MSSSDLVWRSEWAVTAMSNLIVLGFTIEFYRRYRKRSVLLIAISAGIGFLNIVISWMAKTESAIFWNVMSLTNILSALLWIIGLCLLLGDAARSALLATNSTAPPDDGSGSADGNSPRAKGPTSGG